MSGMKILARSRRGWLTCALLMAASSALWSAAAQAADKAADKANESAARFPDHPIRIIVPFSAGGVVDSVTRVVAERMSKTLGQPVIVENKAGAGGAIGTDGVARSAPDGYTLLAVSPSHAVGPLLNASITWNAERDFRAIGGFGMIPNVIAVPAASSAQTLKALLDEARAHPDKLTYASAGVGTSNHLAGALLAQSAGVQITHVPYKGQPEALTDLLGGRVSMMPLTVAIAQSHVKSGKLRALAVTSAKRYPGMPDVPTVAEAAGLPGYEAGAWFGLVAPRKTPDAVVRKLADAVAQAVAAPDVASRLQDLGMDVTPQSAPAFDKYVDAESRKWARVLKASGITAQ
ncbi:MULTISPECIES: tripartite tricarboxylate transporter substrate binding protein [Cupriavidus]|uniref:Tripartite tricarboxylate transporter substrate binding protein n=1 Tax=Cupriavidus campinensis TaxID=151783 RepID=A0AAE9L631_9BURK|nr:tripartite tricarboxylate transporter substrate binding protein [Cupriavidus campinensis]URF07934.1 tripartite tricarboxylate transporter substrate binding protein [Cupriavidus campinensis]